jgi:hypothetical protein
LSQAIHSEKRVGPVMTGPFSDPMMRAILDRFGNVAFGRSSACMEFLPFIRKLGIGGGRALEIGTYHGVTAVLLSQFFEEVVAVSIDTQPERLLRERICEALGITNVRFIACSSNAEKARVIESFDFDFCYSDGDHTNDARADFELVRRCGRVLFHEYWPLQVPVWNLVNSLPDHEVTRADFDCLAYWNAHG